MKDPILFPIDSIERELYNRFTTDYRMNKYSKEDLFDICELAAETFGPLEATEDELEELRDHNRYLREALEEIESIARYGM